MSSDELQSECVIHEMDCEDNYKNNSGSDGIYSLLHSPNNDIEMASIDQYNV